jgi:hypothetical protein
MGGSDNNDALSNCLKTYGRGKDRADAAKRG